mgnify:CR=1 FL=1
MASAADSSSSTSAFISSLIFNLIIFTIFIFLFIHLRPKNERVYQPRKLNDIKTMKIYEKLPQTGEFEADKKSLSSYFSWVPVLIAKPHSFIIQYCSLDGYFFLRYVSLMFFISLLGCFILLPILLPVNATNGFNLKGFSLLSMSNVSNHNRFYAHIFLSWIYFGLILWVIYREMYYYTTMRHAVQLSPLIQSLISSKTVILTDCDMSTLDEDVIRREFDNIDTVTIGKNFNELEKNCQERDKISMKLENTLNKQINKSMKKVTKWSKKGISVEDGLESKPKEDFQSYTKKRPHHKLKTKWYNKIPLIGGGEKVDSIDYYLKRIDELNKEIAYQQENWKTEFDQVGAIFIQFNTQYDAQKCYQTLDYALGKGSFASKYIGYAPNDLVWENVSMNKAVRLGKEKTATTLIVLLLIFWSIPVAVVGCISNINFLTDKVPFLKFIDNCPQVLLGLITGLLPVIMLAVLMMLVPIFIKFLGKKSGLLTYQEIELYCQKWYFAFQVIEVFIVTTLASSATSSVTKIIADPSSAMTLLSSNLPKASNFYIAYFMLLGLTFPSGQLLQIVALILSKVLGRILDSTPRQKWNRYNNLGKPSWGVISPVIELLSVLFVCYAIIQPLILIFSTFALGLYYIAYLYTYNYVSGFSEHNLKGRIYLRALFHIFTALYIAEVCLIGLFVMGKNWGAVVLEAVTLVATAGCHIFCKRRFLPLVNIVPLNVFNLNNNGDVSSESTIRMSEYPKDQGYKDLKNINKQLSEKVNEEKEREKEQIENDEYIRPANDEDLAKANFIPRQREEEQQKSQEVNIVEKQHLPKSTFVDNDGNSEEESNSFNKLHYSDVRKNNNNNVPDISLNPELDRLRNHNQELDLETFPQNDRDRLNKAGLVGMVKSFFKPSETFTLTKVYKELPPFYELVSLDGGIPRPDLGLDNSFGLKNMNPVDDDENKISATATATSAANSNDSKPEGSSSNGSNTKKPTDPFKHGLGAGTVNGYLYPRLTDTEPIIWICKDDMNISAAQITYAKSFGVDVRDENTEYDDKGKSKYLDSPPDFVL